MAEPARKLSFEQALQKLEAIVTEIEAGKVSLEESIDRYAEGIALVKQCRGILDQAEKKIQILVRGDDGTPRLAGEMAEPDAADGEAD